MQRHEVQFLHVVFYLLVDTPYWTTDY